MVVSSLPAQEGRPHGATLGSHFKCQRQLSCGVLPLQNHLTCDESFVPIWQYGLSYGGLRERIHVGEAVLCPLSTEWCEEGQAVGKQKGVHHGACV